MSENNYQVKAQATASGDAEIHINDSRIAFGITPEAADLPNPVELVLSAFAACCLKNVERFSKMLRFEYERAEITVQGFRQDKPSKLAEISYELQVFTNDESFKAALLQKNIEKHSTVYNTLAASCEVSGSIEKVRVHV